MATITLSKTTVIIPRTGGSETITISVSGSTLSNYTVTNTSSGITVSQNASSFTITVASNPNTNSERYYAPLVTAEAADGTTASIQMYVFQKTENITIADSAREKTLQAKESSVYFFLQSNYGNDYTNCGYNKISGDVTISRMD